MKKIWMSALMLLLPVMAWSQKVEINRVYPQEIEAKGFTLAQDASVNVKGTAAVFSDDWRTLVFYGWIINSDTREVVWHLFDERRDRDRDRDREGTYDFDVNVDLKQGNYELYFTGGNGNGSGWNNGRDFSASSLGDIVDAVFDSRRRSKYRDRYADELFISVESAGLKSANVDALIKNKLEGAVVSFNRVREDEDLEKGFTLTAETSLDIYAVGEGGKREVFDYVWIRNAANRERVFEMNYRNTEFAGGAEKNLSLNETIKLPAGSYIVSYVTDDSHSYGEWNALPPDDPEFWGVTVWPSTDADRRNVTDFVQPKTATPLVDLTQVRDDELVSEGLKVTSEVEVRVLCLGEASGNDEMVDYGWIINAVTREKVWEMDAWDAEHAGGADKNRMQQERIKLAPGEYIVYYVTDDSHSYRDWNASRPQEDDLWGISIWATNDADINKVSTFEPKAYKSANVIAEITMVGNDEYIKRTFDLDQDTKVRIIGLGEGTDDEMHDFGYIKNMDTGKIVWEMRYRNSDYAGGARKNREFNETMTLEKGSYRIVYESDGSHAYRRWNADAPRDPERWGISIVKN